MSTNGPEELASWKEIAERLQVTVRTAQEWEKKRGLPVRRVPGGRGRVYVRVSELEAWLDGQLEDGADADAADASPTSEGRGAGSGFGFLGWGGVAVTLLAVVAAVWLLGYFRSSPRAPAGYRIVRDALVILDEEGVELWRVRFDGGLYKGSYDIVANQAVFNDLDGDGSLETLFVLRPADKTLSHALICFDAEGQERWRFPLGRAVRSGGEAFENIYNMGSFRVFDFADGSKGIVLAAIHHLMYPTQVAVLSATDGALRAEYWHSGHIGASALQLAVADVNGDGNREIYLAGVNNSYRQATLVVLDPETMAGASEERDAEHQLRGFAAPREIARVLFRRTAMNLLEDDYNVANNIWVTDELITVGTLERINDDAGPVAVSYLRPDFTVDHVSFGSSFPTVHERLRQEGRITITMDEQEEMLLEVEYVGVPRSLIAAGSR